MKYKRKRGSEVPLKIRSFIDKVISSTLESIPEQLKGFVWEFDKGNFHHWVDLFNHFDSFFDKCLKPSKDLQIEEDFQEADPIFPRETILQILRVTRIILENCANKHFYSSYVQHLSLLLASTDADVIEASLQTLTAFVNKPVPKFCLPDASLTSKLFVFSQGWGGKEEGLGLIACSLKNGFDPVASEIGSTLHFEFYSVDYSNISCGTKNVSQGLHVIHIPNINSYNENDLELFHKLVKEHSVPPSLRFSMLTKLRFARAFVSIDARHQYICIRLLAFIVFVQAGHDADGLSTFFNNEPEFINELVLLLSHEDEIPERIQILAILSLVALSQDRVHGVMVFTSVTSGSNRGILPSLTHKAIGSIISGSTKWSIVFGEALLYLVNELVSSSPGSLALREAGFIPSLLPLLKDTNPQHLHLVSTAVHIVEGFLDYNNPAALLFRNLGGLDDTIERLKVEVSFVENGSKKIEDTQYNSKGKQLVNGLSELDMQPFHSETLVSYNKKLLLKALLRAISLATYVPRNPARISSEENVLPQCLSMIFRRAKDFGGGVFSLAAVILSEQIHKDPTRFPILKAADLPGAFVDAILGSVPCSAEAVKCIPQCLDALCLNNAGLQLVQGRNALNCFAKIFTSRSYLRALCGNTIDTLSSGLDELMRHTTPLRASGVDMLIDILNSILKIGSGSDSYLAVDSLSSSTPVPMETDLEEVSSALHGEEATKMGTSGRMFGEPSDGSSLSIESVLPEYVSNAARLLETILHTADTCRVFIEKKGVEMVLKLFTLPLMPFSASISQSISVAFKRFSPQHSAALARTVSSFIREHLNLTNHLLDSLCGTKLAEVEYAKQIEILKCLSSLQGLLSLSNFLLKRTPAMVSELGSSDASILVELGKIYKETLWEISLSCDSKAGENRDTDQEAGTGDASISNIAGRVSDDDGTIVPQVRYMNPVSIRSTWHGRHGRHGLSRLRWSRISRQLDTSYIDSEGSFSTVENSPILDTKKKSPDMLVSEVLTKLSSAIRSFHASLLKGSTARHRSETALPSSTAKSFVTALGKLFYDALTYSGHSTACVGMSLSLKCRYLGKVVDDMAALTFDIRHRTCNAALVNSFYANGTFKELLTTFEATSQLLWTLPFSFPNFGPDQITSVDDKGSDSSWLLVALQSYCRLLEYYVNSSLLLSPTSSSQSQLLVQPVAAGLSIGLFPIPTDPEQFVHVLQSQVLDVILPVWNHPMFHKCSPAFISSVISIVTHIYSGVRDPTPEGGAVTGVSGQGLTAPPLDESTIATIVEMGFTRVRAEEALRNMGTNSVELATDWLFSHPEEFVQEDVQIAQALALSLGTSSETTKDNRMDDTKSFFIEKRGAEAPPVDDILAASMKLFLSSDLLAFPLTDLLVTLCNRNKAEDRPRVALYLIQQLKLCPSDFSKDTGALGPISHVLALILNQDSCTREIASEKGVVSVVLGILMNIRVNNGSRNVSAAEKPISALLLILDSMLQSKPNFHIENAERSSKSLSGPAEVDISLSLQLSAVDKIPVEDGLEKESINMFEKIIGKSTGFLSLEESRKALTIACELLKEHVPAMVIRAVLQLIARLTKTHAIAIQFLESGCLSALFSLPKFCIYPGFDSFASAIVRHLLEDHQTLQTAMEMEIRKKLLGTLSRHAGRLSPRLFLTSMAPIIFREPATFMRAAAAVCQLESSGGRIIVALLREKEKDKEKSKASIVENGIHSNEPIRMLESKANDTPGKSPRSYKRSATHYQVIDQLLEIITSYPSPRMFEECTSSFVPVGFDGPVLKEKGKSKIDERKVDFGDLHEKSAVLAKVTIVLKLMSDIILMYVNAVGVLLKRDSEMCHLRGFDQAVGPGHGGILHHILHNLLPLSSEKTEGSSDDWTDKLSEKASWILVVLCGRSAEGRKRIICELVKAFSSMSNSESNSSKNSLLPDKKVLTFVNLVNSILSINSSPNALTGPGCSPDIAKAMIDGGVVQSLSDILRVIDLDHPDAPKAVNLILKALECLTRAANSCDQVYKLDGLTKKRSTQGATDNQTNLGAEMADHDQIANMHHDATDVIRPEGQVHESPPNEQGHDANTNQLMQQDMPIDRQDAISTNPRREEGMEFMPDELDLGGVLPNTNEVGLAFRVEQLANDDTGEDEYEDMVENDDDEEHMAEGAALISPADTDVEDHDGNGMDDEYNDDDMIYDEEEYYPDNNAIQVRLTEGLPSIDRFQVLRSGDAGSFSDHIATEPFQGINGDDMLRPHQQLGVERRQQSGNRTSFDRSRPNGSAYPHPLLLRPSQSVEPVTSMLSAAGNSSRDLYSSSFGSFEVPQTYMLHGGVPSERADSSIIGDHSSSAAPPSFDFSLGMQSLHIGGRRGDSRWTDDGQPQACGHAAAIAQAIEEQFISQLRGTVSINNPLEHSLGQAKEKSLDDSSREPVAENISTEPIGGQLQEQGTESIHDPGNLVADGGSCPLDLTHGITTSLSVEAEDGQVAQQIFSDVLNMPHHPIESMDAVQGSVPSVPVDTNAEMDTSPEVQTLDYQMQDSPSNPHNRESDNGCRHVPSGSESHSCSHAIINSGSTMTGLSGAHTGSTYENADCHTNGVHPIEDHVESFIPATCNGEESNAARSTEGNRVANEGDQVSIDDETTNTNAIDPTFLEALPEDLLVEFLASQQSQRTQTVAYAPPLAQDIDPTGLSGAHTGSIYPNADCHTNGVHPIGDQVDSFIPSTCNVEESNATRITEGNQVANEGGQIGIIDETTNTNTIDPTFLEALPEDLRAEVLASQQSQPTQTVVYAPPLAQDIDPEFLAALPPDIQAEVLAQQQTQRTVHSHQVTGQPVDMDNASIIATFTPDLREEVLLTSSEAVLSALPSALLAEARMLRDRATRHHHIRSSFHRIGGRWLESGPQTMMNRGVATDQRTISAIVNKVQEIEGTPLLDINALRALVRLLRLSQPLDKGLLQRLLLNLCANSVTSAVLVALLVDMLRPETDNSSGTVTSQRLYGCQWNAVIVRSQPSDGLPLFVSRRVLEYLAYLATNNSSVANIFLFLDPSMTSEPQNVTCLENKKEKGKEKIVEAKSSSSTAVGDIPLILFLKLLKQPLFLRSNAHLEQLMGLVQVVVHNAVTKCQTISEQAAGTSDIKSSNGVDSTSEQNPYGETNQDPTSTVPYGKRKIKPYDVLSKLPESELHNLCNILANEGLSDKVYSLAANVLKKLAFVATSHGKFFTIELAGLAHSLTSSAVLELATLRSTHMLGLSAGSMAGDAILRVLQVLGELTSLDGNKVEDVGAHEEQSILWNLNVSLEPLWQELSECISTSETKLGQGLVLASPVPAPHAGDISGDRLPLSPPLLPGTQRLLPFIEAFFVLCEKLQTNQTTTLTDSNDTAREVKECSGSSLSPSLRSDGNGSLTFARIAERHRRLLNVFIRQNPSLLEKSLSMMLKVPRLIDFDNKRAYFRSRIRQHHDQNLSAPFRISVRRAYVLEDSYNQLRLRPTQELKGRLTVQFQGEEGIDAGGLTREWYQLLSRVIFDKGALLFTTVGSNSTFQPNPNSVYQTEHLSYFKFVGRVVAKAVFDGQLLDVYFTRSFYKHILGVKVTYHDIEAVDPDYYKNLKWMLENDVTDIPDLTFSMDADEEKHILYEKTEVTDYELIPGGSNIRVTEETKHEYVDLVAEHILTTAIRPQINAFLEGFNELVPREIISIFNDKELELLISGLPEIDLDDLRANTEYTGFTAASAIINWFWDVVKAFNKEDMARFLQFVTGTSKVPLEGFKALQGLSGSQRFQIHKAYGAPERLPSAHTCFNQLDLPEYSSKEQLEERLLLAIHEGSEGFGFG